MQTNQTTKQISTNLSLCSSRTYVLGTISAVALSEACLTLKQVDTKVNENEV